MQTGRPSLQARASFLSDLAADFELTNGTYVSYL